jgi:hypothetical protein
MTRAEAWRICLARRVAAWERRSLALAAATTPEQEREIRAEYKTEWEAAADEWDQNMDEWIRTSKAEQNL